MVVSVLAVTACASSPIASPPEAGAPCPAFVAEAFSPSDGPQTGDHLRYDYDIVLLDEDLRPGRLLTDDGRSYDPDFSPDGQQIAYSSGRGYALGDENSIELASVWMIGTDGVDDTQLTQGASDRSPRWSPDGRRLAFQRETGHGPLLMVLDVDSGELRELGQIGVYDLDWFSDGQLEGTTYDETTQASYLLRVDIATGRQERVELGVEDVRSVVLWSPDRTEFAYVDTVDYLNADYHPEDRPTIKIHTLATGAERTVPGSNTKVNDPLLWTAGDEILFRQNIAGEGYNLALSGHGGRDPERVVGVGQGRYGQLGEQVSDPVSDNPACGS